MKDSPNTPPARRSAFGAEAAGRVVRILLLTYVAIRLFWFFSALGGRATESVTVEAALKLALWLPLSAITAWFLVPGQPASPFEELGLSSGFGRGLAFGAAATVPMLVAIAFLDRKSLQQDLVAGSAIIGPLAEEILFRGFLFRQLVRRARWPMWAALALSSVAFGFAHTQGIDPVIWNYHVWVGDLPTFVLSLIERALPYAAGGALFAWVTHRWNSLWPAIALHGFMNFWWDLTRGEHAQLVFRIDGMSAAQAISIVLAIALTLRWTRNVA